MQKTQTASGLPRSRSHSLSKRKALRISEREAERK